MEADHYRSIRSLKAAERLADDCAESAADRKIHLKAYVTELKQNGIRQHAPEWHVAKGPTIGGSQIAVIMGINPFETLYSLIRKKVIPEFKPAEFTTKQLCMDWGNLFEPVIETYISMDKDVKIMGRNSFAFGKAGTHTSYSPDGFGVLMLRDKPLIVLFEFKVPFTRIPGRSPPKYYVPQVLLGLEVNTICDTGMYAEGVFRRCKWEDLEPTQKYNEDLGQKSKGPLNAFGFMGFSRPMNAGERIDAMIRKEYGDGEHQYNDLGGASPELIRDLICMVALKQTCTWHSPIIRANDDCYADALNAALTSWAEYAAASGEIPLGIMGWKVFHVGYFEIERVPNFLAPLQDDINYVVNAVADCKKAIDADDLATRLKKYVMEATYDVVE